MSDPPPPFQPDLGQPHAQVSRSGRFTYTIIIIDGLTEYGPHVAGVLTGWTRFSRASAERKARVELARYRRKILREERWEVGP
jgi:hypothetical protein